MISKVKSHPRAPLRRFSKTSSGTTVVAQTCPDSKKDCCAKIAAPVLAIETVNVSVLADVTKEKIFNDGRPSEFRIQEDAADHSPVRQTKDTDPHEGVVTHFKKYSKPTRRVSRNEGRNLSAS